MHIAVTGHRHDKLGGYSPTAFRTLQVLAEQELIKLAPTTVLTGMALGWDQAVAAACVKLGLPFVACVPFAGQDRIWPAQSSAGLNTKRYSNMIGACDASR